MKSPISTKSILPIMLVIFTLPYELTCTNHSHSNGDDTESSLWYRVGEMTGFFLKTCLDISATPHSGKEFMDAFQNCLRRKSLLILDRSMRADVISVSSGIQLVKYRDVTPTHSDKFSGMESSRFIRDQMDWNDEVMEKLLNMFDSYELKIDLSNDNASMRSRQPRGRRRKEGNNMMVSLLVFAMIAVGLIVIPMGFQFLAVLGGKALLLAKLALILSSIQGLKKIATSSFNYGLYSHSAPGNPWHYDRQWSIHQPQPYDSPPEGYHGNQESYHYMLHPRVDTEN